MGSVLPVLSRREVVRIFEVFGWEMVRQVGSHMVILSTQID